MQADGKEQAQKSFGFGLKQPNAPLDKNKSAKLQQLPSRWFVYGFQEKPRKQEDSSSFTHLRKKLL